MIGRDSAAYSDQSQEATLLTTIVGHLENKAAIDVGAGRGGSMRILLDAGATSVYAFEPSPSDATALRTEFAETSTVQVAEVALGAEEGQTTLYITEDDIDCPGEAISTLVAPVETPTRRTVGEIPIACRTLDALVAEGTVPAEVGLLKVDAERSDFAVLHGMGRFFSAVVAIEYRDEWEQLTDKGAYRVAEVARFMAERHYANWIVVKRHDRFATLHINAAQTQPGDRGSVVFIHDTVFPNLSLPIFAVASAAQTHLIDRAQKLEAEAQRQARVIEELARMPGPSTAVGRLEVLEEQELALEVYCRVAREDGPWQWVTQQLGVLYQHPPLPFYVPEHYLQISPLASPPTISIVTPMLNGAQFIQFTLDSVLDQVYPALDYIIQDGGSTDDAMHIVEQYRPRLAQIQSERDTGMAQAINRGFSHSTGEIMAYLNADDLLLPGTLQFVASYFTAHPDVDVIYGHRVLIDADHAEVGRWVLPRHDNDILSWTDYVPQESLFWRRAIWDRVGGAMDETFRFALDWDLLLRFRDAGATFVRVPRFLAAFRVHGNQKTATELAGVGAEEIFRIREREAGRPISPAEIRQNVEPYIRRHKVYHKLYRLGVLAY